MIIKSMARKEASFAQLVAYMEKDSGDRVLYHNFYGHDRMRTEEIVREFDENARRLPRRKNGNALYHEILSLSAGRVLDRAEARRILADIGYEYLSRRAPGQLAYGTLHRDTDHLHLHLCISSNELGKQNRVRLSKREFAEVQKEVEAIVLERYPELGQERIYTKDRTKERVKTASREQQFKERTGKASRKEGMAGIVHGLLEYAGSAKELDALLARHGFKVYRRGKTFGLVDAEGKRHRMKTLGLDLHFSAALERFGAPRELIGPTRGRDTGEDADGRAGPAGVERGDEAGRRGTEPGQEGRKRETGTGRTAAGEEERKDRADARKADLDRAAAASREREDRERGR
ncbi:MAG: relaxase/mobilization nuclease domain-containing protein [Patescibacteria group bacterium]